MTCCLVKLGFMGMEIQIYIYFFMPMESLGKLGLSSFYKFKAKSISPHAFLLVFTSSRLGRPCMLARSMTQALHEALNRATS
jgi:hypothetical protein